MKICPSSADVFLLISVVIGVVLTNDNENKVSAHPTSGEAEGTASGSDVALLNQLVSESNILRLRKIGNISNRLQTEAKLQQTRIPNVVRERCIERRDTTDSLMDYLRVAEGLISHHLTNPTSKPVSNRVSNIVRSLFVELRGFTRHAGKQIPKYKIKNAGSQSSACIRQLSTHIFRLTKTLLGSKQSRCNFYPIKHMCRRFLRSCHCSVRRV